MPGCTKRVVHIPHHLREVHKWNKHRAKAAVNRFSLRKNYTSSNSSSRKVGSTKKDYHRRHCCPMPKCSSVVKRLSSHLQKQHKMNPNTSEYKGVVARARIMSDEPHIFTHLKMQAKRRRESAGEVSYLLAKKRCMEWEDSCAPLSGQSSCFQGETSTEEGDEGKNDREDNTEGERNSGGEDADKSLSPEDQVIADNNDWAGHSDMDMSSEETTRDGPASERNGYGEDLMESFSSWLMSPDGGKLETTTAKQHSKQLRHIVQIIDEEKRWSSLLKVTLVRDKFLQGHAKSKYLAGTIKSHLMSLRHFYAFLLSEEPPEVPFNKPCVVNLMDKMQRWSTSYKQESRKRHWEKLEDQHALIGSQTVNEFERSQAARDAISLLGQIVESDSVEVTQASYTLIRDFLFVEIQTDNANRAGVLAHMTMEELSKAQKRDSDYVILVKHQKTSASHGSARIVLTTSLYNWLRIFVEKVRPKICGDTEKNNVFLSWNGESLHSSQINKAIKSIWKKAGVKGSPSSTTFRKSAVSTMHEQHHDLSANLADLMAHNLETARKYYRVTEKSKSSVKAAKQLRSAMRSSEREPEVLTTKLADEDKHKEIHSLEPEAAKEESSTCGRLPWSAESVEALRSLFKKRLPISLSVLIVSEVRYKNTICWEARNQNGSMIV